MDRYEKLSSLGEGSYGIVYMCRGRDPGALVAVQRFVGSEDDPDIKKLLLKVPAKTAPTTWPPAGTTHRSCSSVTLSTEPPSTSDQSGLLAEPKSLQNPLAVDFLKNCLDWMDLHPIRGLARGLLSIRSSRITTPRNAKPIHSVRWMWLQQYNTNISFELSATTSSSISPSTTTTTASITNKLAANTTAAAATRQI